MAATNWKACLERFFDDQAVAVEGVPTLLDQQGQWEGLVQSIERALTLDQSSNVLEVGCASGYIACGLAPRVGQ